MAKYKPEFCKIAQDVLANGESLAAICAELEITRTTLYEWRSSKPEFGDAIDIGLQKAQREWERIGRNGIEGEYEKFAASPWIFTMKNRFREDYKEEKEEQKDEALSLLERIMTGEIKVKT